MESESKVISSLVAVLSAFIVPLIEELINSKVKEELEPTTISPTISWLFKVIVTVPPFEPEVPQSPSSIKINVPEPKVKVQLVKAIFASVFVI